ncbi:uncharacterized protein DKFZp434B061-like [Fopius arisanus]|uniref:Uncharacterized protein DKFZp434B061-like n=1 Tax=Fopius arisanus TaxID=64838 RepID=A0A9R1TNH4_9HYME|nr:PREDICTED: uncharacterized protein DKFZp434B061-like [Fopius arisanus]
MPNSGRIPYGRGKYSLPLGEEAFPPSQPPRAWLEQEEMLAIARQETILDRWGIQHAPPPPFPSSQQPLEKKQPPKKQPPEKLPQETTLPQGPPQTTRRTTPQRSPSHPERPRRPPPHHLQTQTATLTKPRTNPRRPPQQSRTQPS